MSNKAGAPEPIRIDRQTLSFVKGNRKTPPDAVVGDASKLRTYSKLNADELKALYFNEALHEVEPYDYNTLLQIVRTLALRFLDQPP